MSAMYKIVFDDSADRYAAKRFGLQIPSQRLASKILELQRNGSVIISVEKVADV